MCCAGAILAGGMSTRMGRDKAGLKLRDGRTMIETVCNALATVCSDVVIVDRFAESARSPSIDSDWMSVTGAFTHVVHDLRPQAGPLGGIEALLSSGIAPQYLVCPCDVPRISSDLLGLLIRPSTALAAVFHVEGTANHAIEPLPARISAAALPIAQELLALGQQSVWRLMERLRPDIVTISPMQGKLLLNVNTAEDLRRANDES
jgi:molybdopterin-guanine dinucleotide biosynthesis protein A